MAGSLVKIDEEIVTSPVASVTLGGADWDSSYDVYMVDTIMLKMIKLQVGMNIYVQEF